MNNTGNLIITTPSDREIVMTRVFDAPREMVFKAWTDPKQLGRWNADVICSMRIPLLKQSCKNHMHAFLISAPAPAAYSWLPQNVVRCRSVST